MDVVLEVIIQLVVQVLVEVVGEFLLEGAFRGAVGVAGSPWGRRVAGAVLGVLAGYLWGKHLSGGQHWPKLLWVSVSISAAALVLAVSRRSSPRAENQESPWRQVLQPPWAWSARRLLDAALLNVGIAGGVLIGFRHGS